MEKFCRPFKPLGHTARKTLLRETLAQRAAKDGLWMFAYGSLMWHVGVPYTTRLPARLVNWRRQFCVWTTLARGTLAQPGLALGLLPGGACEGRAYFFAEAILPKVLPEIWRREMWTDVYQPSWVDLQIDGGTVRGLTFTVNLASRQFAGNLDLARQAAVIANASGERGRCRDYLELTLAELAALGIVEPELAALQTAVVRLAN